MSSFRIERETPRKPEHAKKHPPKNGKTTQKRFGPVPNLANLVLILEKFLNISQFGSVYLFYTSSPICAMVKSRYIGDGHPTFNRNPL